MLVLEPNYTVYYVVKGEEEKAKSAAKGIPKPYVRKHIRHDRFLAALESKMRGGHCHVPNF